MAASFNKYTAIFNKWKAILNADSRTSAFAVYGAEHEKKKSMPCILIFPEVKTWLEDPGTQTFRKAALPKEVSYTFNFWAYIQIQGIEDAYYNNTNDAKAGLTQVLTELENVLKDYKSANDLVDPTIQLWFNTRYSIVEISQKPGKLMHGRISVDFISKELA